MKLSERQTEDYCVTDRVENVKGEFKRLAAGEFDWLLGKFSDIEEFLEPRRWPTVATVYVYTQYTH